MSNDVTPQEIQMMLSWAAAKKGNKNNSGMLGNMDNALMTYAAGVYDPVAAQGEASSPGSFWSRYSQSDEPAIKDIMDKITQGFDQYQINSYIDALAAGGKSIGSFQIADLKGVAKSLQKEYTDGPKGGGGDGWKKNAEAGLRNPLDLYSPNDLPVGANAKAGISKIDANGQSVLSMLKAAQNATAAAQNNLGPLFNGFDELGRAKGPSVQQMMTYVENNQKLKDQLPGDGMGQIDPKTGNIYTWRGTQEQKAYNVLDPRNMLNLINAPVRDVARTAEMIGNSITGKPDPNIQDLVGGYLPTQKNSDALTKAKRKEGLATGQANAAMQAKAQYQQGMMRAVAESGRTPLGDQLQKMLRFTALSK